MAEAIPLEVLPPEITEPEAAPVEDHELRDLIGWHRWRRGNGQRAS